MFKANKFIMSDGKVALFVYDIDNWKEDIAANDVENSDTIENKEKTIVPEEIVVNITDNVTRVNFGKKKPIHQNNSDDEPLLA